MSNLDLEKAEEPEIQLPASVGSFMSMYGKNHYNIVK